MSGIRRVLPRIHRSVPAAVQPRRHGIAARADGDGHLPVLPRRALVRGTPKSVLPLTRSHSLTHSLAFAPCAAYLRGIIPKIAIPRRFHSLLLEACPNPSRRDLGRLLPTLRHGPAPALPTRDLPTHDVRGLPRPANPAPPPSADLPILPRPPPRSARRVSTK